MRPNLLIAFLCWILAAIIAPLSAQSEVITGSCGPHATYTFDGSTMTISGTGNITNTLTAYKNTLTRLNIQEGITAIDAYAFNSFKNLGKVSFPSTLEKVGTAAFSYTDKLEKAIFHSKVSIGVRAFFSSGIKEFYLEDGEFESGQIYDSLIFGLCENITKMTLPVSNEKDFRKIFSCYKYPSQYGGGEAQIYTAPTTLKSLTIYARPEASRDFSVESLGSGYYTKEPNGSISYWLWTCNLALGVVDTLRIIPSELVRSIDISGSVSHQKYGTSAEYDLGLDFKHLDLSKINIDETSSSTGNLNIYTSSNLEHLVLPKASQYRNSLFGEFFSENTSGYAVTQEGMDGKKHTYYIPQTLKKVEIKRDEDMILPYGWMSGFNTIEEVRLPASVYEVGEKAFRGCSKIKDLYCAGADPAVAYENSFEGMRMTSCVLHVPVGASDYYKMSSGWKSFFNIEESGPLRLTIQKNIENGGVVYGVSRYFPGETVTLNAVANSGYKFSSWHSSAGNSLSPNYSFTIEDDTVVNVNFDSVDDDNDVEVTVGGSSATISWPWTESVTHYNVLIWRLDENSRVVELVSATRVYPDSRAVRTSAPSQSCVVNDLTADTNYKYDIAAYGEGSVLLSRFTGKFAVASSIMDASMDPCGGSFNLIQGGLKIDGAGQSVSLTNVSGGIVFQHDNLSEAVINVAPGVYIITIGNSVNKIFVK